MCTSIAINKDGLYFGRNMDLEFDFGDGAVVMPRNYALRFRCGEIIRRHFAMVGMATVVDGYPLFAEGMNECGVCIAGLHFPGNAHYARQVENGKVGIAPFELIPYLLARARSVEDVRGMLEKAVIAEVPFNEEIPTSPLHWHIADKRSSIVLEVTRGGMNVYENPYGVLANNPPFPFHRDHLALYMNLEQKTPENARSFDVEIFGGGLMAHGLPGDYSSPSRFVKAAWLRACADWDEDEMVECLLCVLGAVAPPKSAVINSDGKAHFTRYSCCMDAEREIYYLKGYKMHSLLEVDIKKESLDGEALILYPLQPKSL